MTFCLELETLQTTAQQTNKEKLKERNKKWNLMSSNTIQVQTVYIGLCLFVY